MDVSIKDIQFEGYRMLPDKCDGKQNERKQKKNWLSKMFSIVIFKYVFIISVNIIATYGLIIYY